MPTIQSQQGDHSIGPHFTREQLAHWSQTAIGMWNPMSAAMQFWNAQCGTALTAVGLEWSSFLARRLKEDIELPMRLASAKSPEDFWTHYSAFWTKMAYDYQQEFDALARLSNERTQQSLELFRSTFDTNGGERTGRSARH